MHLLFSLLLASADKEQVSLLVATEEPLPPGRKQEVDFPPSRQIGIDVIYNPYEYGCDRCIPVSCIMIFTMSYGKSQSHVFISDAGSIDCIIFLNLRNYNCMRLYYNHFYGL